MRRTLLCALAAAGPGTAVLAAQVVRGTVVASVGRTPVHGAHVVSRTSGTAAVTDRLGRFALPSTGFPDTVVVRAIGWSPDSAEVRGPDSLFVIALDRAPVMMHDLVARGAARPLELGGHGRWQMPMAAASSIPAAVEPDVLRALTLVPAISFSSPLSARPLMRGYDAEEVTTRVDGFELFNLYHLGRLFASFPAEAAEELTVSAAPFDPTSGNSVAGIVDITGRTGADDGAHGGLSWSYGSLTAFGGGGNGTVRVFGTARTFYWKSLELIPEVDVPYHFADLYAGAVFGPATRPTGRLTAFITRDRAGDAATNRFLDWDNALVGGRWRVIDGTATSLEAAASGTRVRQNGRNVPGLHSLTHADLRNDFSRINLSADLTHTGTHLRLALGASVGLRRIENVIAAAGADPDRRPLTSDAPTAATSLARTELGLYAQASRRLGAVALDGSLRLDAAGGLAMLLPSVRARWNISPQLEISGGVGRTSRLYHLLAETRSEPDFDFLDFWLPAGDAIPPARVDHASVDLRVDLNPVVARAAAYASSGTGIGELRPGTDQRPHDSEFFRFGQARTSGFEIQIAAGGDGSPHAASVSYVWSRSERRYRDDWVRWSLDRRHQLRGFVQTTWGRLRLNGAFDVASGTPVTPILIQAPPPSVPGLDAGGSVGAPVYGREGSAATSGTFRIDAGLTLAFRGPARSRMTFGASVINLFGTATAPFGETGSGPFGTTPDGRPTLHRRLFTLPPIPTLLIRAEF